MKYAVEVKNLIKKYPGSNTLAVNNVSFSVPAGQFFSLLGPNGAGKTTTISILTTTLSKTSGEVMVAGYDVAHQSDKVRKNIGIIFQKPSLDQNLTAEENIRFHAALYGLYDYRPSFLMMPKPYQSKILELAQILELASTDMTKPVKELSGGMKRKLEIIRSLLHEPKVLFLDEPTSGLDPLSRKNLWEYLAKIRKENGTTIFLTTHYLEEAEGSDMVCVINNGSVVAMGTPIELKKKFATQHTSLEQVYLKIISQNQ